MEVIVPAAGASSRFPGMKPKYLLFGYDGKMMIHKAVERYLDHDDIVVTVGILKEHDEKYNSEMFLRNEMGNQLFVTVLNEPTRGPAATVYNILAEIIYANPNENILDEPLLIKDCDSFFDHDIRAEGNYVCVSAIQDHWILKKLASKSFCVYNEQNMITSIVEKNVVSDHFCVGGYRFESVRLFMEAFEAISNIQGEIFVSHVIQWLISHGHHFRMEKVTNYIDVGTAEDWFEYNDRPVIFCDIDGTLIKAQSRYGSNSYDTKPQVIQENVDILLTHQYNGSQLIFTTARPLEYRLQTKIMLEDLGFRNFQLIAGLNNSYRVLINDYNSSNPYPRAVAVNIKRDANNLGDFFPGK